MLGSGTLPANWADYFYIWGAMPTPVRRCGHENLRTNMATAEYRRGHGTPHFFKVICPVPTIPVIVGRLVGL